MLQNVEVQVMWGKQNTVLFIPQLQETGPQVKRRCSLFSFSRLHITFHLRNFTSDNMKLIV